MITPDENGQIHLFFECLLPDWAKYLAPSYDGTWYVYSYKPEIDLDKLSWESTEGSTRMLLKTSRGVPDWDLRLQEINWRNEECQ